MVNLMIHINKCISNVGLEVYGNYELQLNMELWIQKKVCLGWFDIYVSIFMMFVFLFLLYADWLWGHRSGV